MQNTVRHRRELPGQNTTGLHTKQPRLHGGPVRKAKARHSRGGRGWWVHTAHAHDTPCRDAAAGVPPHGPNTAIVCEKVDADQVYQLGQAGTGRDMPWQP